MYKVLYQVICLLTFYLGLKVIGASAAAQICINIHPDAVPPIHAESYHVATDKGPLQVKVYF